MAESFQTEQNMRDVVDDVLATLERNGVLFKPAAKDHVMDRLRAADPSADAHDAVRDAIMAEVR